MIVIDQDKESAEGNGRGKSKYITRRDTNPSPAGGSAKNNNKGRGICWLKRINFSLLDNTKDRNIVC